MTTSTLYPDLLLKRAELSPAATAMTDLSSGDSVSYQALHENAAACSNLIREAGVKPGDRVAILCRNRIEFFETLFACARIGAVLVPLNWRSPPAELASILQNCRPALVFVGAEDRKSFAATGYDAVIIDLDEKSVDGYEARRTAARSLSRDLRDFWPAREPWYLLYTSGTTGHPKAVIQTYEMAVINYINVRQATNISASDTTLNFLPLFHSAGINLYTLPALFAGAHVSILPGFDADKTISLLTSGALSIFFGVPAIYQELSLHADFNAADLTKARNWGCGGAPLPDLLVETFTTRGARVCNGYGMTETGPTAFLMDDASVTEKIGSVGKAQIMTMARTIGTDGAPCKPLETGELQLKGPGITPGYWENDAATKAAFTEDGWLRTGDLARTDEDGYTYIVGRSKEMYISGGENVYPAEVENILARHPAILEAAVIGVPDQKWGEVGHAFILLRDGFDAEAMAIKEFLAEQLAGYKVPKKLDFVEDFPRTAAGKIQKHLLVQESAS